MCASICVHPCVCVCVCVCACACADCAHTYVRTLYMHRARGTPTHPHAVVQVVEPKVISLRHVKVLIHLIKHGTCFALALNGWYDNKDGHNEARSLVDGWLRVHLRPPVDMGDCEMHGSLPQGHLPLN